MRSRIVAVDSAPEYRDGVAGRLECAAMASASTPRARPLTTTSPAAAKSRPRLRAIWRP